MTTRYEVVMVERHADGWVVRKMLVAKFVAKGDAIAYAMWRRDTMLEGGVQFEFAVETPGAVRGGNVFTAKAGSDKVGA